MASPLGSAGELLLLRIPPSLSLSVSVVSRVCQSVCPCLLMGNFCCVGALRLHVQEESGRHKREISCRARLGSRICWSDGIRMVRWLLSSLSLRSAMTFLSFSDHVWGSLDGRSAGLAALGTYSK